MGEAPMTAADVGAVIGNRGNGWGDGMGGGFWIFALIVLAFMGRGFGWGGGDSGNGGGCLTTAESCNMNSFNELKSQVGRMNDMMFTNARQVDNAICNSEYTTLQNFNALQRQLDNCCCELKTAIHQEGELNRTQQYESKIDSLQRQLSDVKTQQLFCGVPRIPTTFTYAVNPGSLFGNGCCGNSCGTTF